MNRRYFDHGEARRDAQHGARRIETLTQLRHLSRERGHVTRTDAKTIDYVTRCEIYPAYRRRAFLPVGTATLPIRNIRVRFFMLRTGTVGTTMRAGMITQILNRANEILRPAFVRMQRVTPVDPFEVPEFEDISGTQLTHSSRNNRFVRRAIRRDRLRGRGTLNVIVVRDMVYPDMDVLGSHMPGSDFVFIDQGADVNWLGRAVVHEFLHRLGADHYMNDRNRDNIMYEGRHGQAFGLNAGQIRNIRRWAVSEED